MAHFRGTVEGQGSGTASRLGSEKSGLVVRANGWNLGVKVVARVGAEGEDIFEVFSTGGSNGSRGEALIATVDFRGTVYPEQARAYAEDLGRDNERCDREQDIGPAGP